MIIIVDVNNIEILKFKIIGISKPIKMVKSIKFARRLSFKKILENKNITNRKFWDWYINMDKL